MKLKKLLFPSGHLYFQAKSSKNKLDKIAFDVYWRKSKFCLTN